MKTRISVSATVALLLSACTAPLNEWPSSKAGMKAAEPVIAELRTYKRFHGTYPDALSALPATVASAARDHGLRYHAHEDGSAYTIGFDPWGPVHLCAYGEGFGRSVPRWQCTVK